jgi:hypothetical protein
MRLGQLTKSSDEVNEVRQGGHTSAPPYVIGVRVCVSLGTWSAQTPEPSP